MDNEKLKITRHLSRITNKDFVLSANQLNYESEIATYVVPANRMFEIPNDFIGLKLMTKDHFEFSTGSSETTHVCTLTYPIAPDPLIPAVRGYVVVHETSPAAAEWTNFTVTLPKTVTLAGLTSSKDYVFDIYYLFGVGSLNISVLSSDGTAKTKILERAIRAVNMLNQEDIRTGLKPGMIGLCIPERYKIQVRVITPAPVILYDSQETSYSSPWARESFIELPINESSLAEWPKGIENYAKQQLMGL